MTYVRITRENLDLLHNLPADTTVLVCDDLGLTHLPDLPPTLQILTCSRNQLIYLPDLPETLEHLDCDETLHTLYGFQHREDINAVRQKVNRWNAANLQQDYVLK